MSRAIVGADVNSQGTTQLYQLGAKYFDEVSQKVYTYVKANGTMAQYEYCSITPDGLYLATSLTTTTNPSTAPGLVGVQGLSGGLVANSYFWAQRQGAHTGLFAASCVQSVKIYTTAVAGVVDDASTTLIAGLYLITTIVGAAASLAFAEVEMTTATA